MLENSKAFSGFAVDDMDKAREFYEDVLGLKTSTQGDGLGLVTLQLAGGRDTLIYPKPNHTPADYTILNFPVPDIDQAVAQLTERGVRFEHYDGMEQADNGVFLGDGPKIAWFTDPAGNILSVIQQD